MRIPSLEGLHIGVVRLYTYCALPNNAPQAAYVIEIKVTDRSDLDSAVIILQDVARLVGSGTGLPRGAQGAQYGAFVNADSETGTVWLSQRKWSQKTADAAQAIMRIIANTHGWVIVSPG